MKAPILAHVTWYKMPVLNLDGGSLCSVWWALSAAVFGRVVSVGFGLGKRGMYGPYTGAVLCARSGHVWATVRDG